MAINQAYATAVELTAAARAAADALTASLPLSAFLPNQTNYTLGFEFEQNSAIGVDQAAYRGFDAETPGARADQPKITKSGKLPPLGRKVLVGEYAELLANQQASTALHDKLVGYAEERGREIALRLEFARAEAIRTGKLALNENGLRGEIDFGRKANRSVSLVTGKVWSKAEATPVDDIIEWRNLLANDASSSAPATIIVTSDVMEALSKNAQVIGFALGRGDNLPGRITYDQVRGVLSSFGIYDVRVTADVYSGFAIPGIIPNGTVLLLPAASTAGLPGSLGSTEFGVPTEALNGEYGIAEGERAGIFAGAFNREDPQGLWVHGTALALPVVRAANSTLSAKVL